MDDTGGAYITAFSLHERGVIDGVDSGSRFLLRSLQPHNSASGRGASSSELLPSCRYGAFPSISPLASLLPQALIPAEGRCNKRRLFPRTGDCTAAGPARTDLRRQGGAAGGQTVRWADLGRGDPVAATSIGAMTSARLDFANDLFRALLAWSGAGASGLAEAATSDITRGNANCFAMKEMFWFAFFPGCKPH